MASTSTGPATTETGEKAEKASKKSSDKDVDVSSSDRGVWLVKVPKFIADRWAKAAASSEVGKLKIRRLPGSKPDVTISLSDHICAPIAGLSEMDKLNLVRNSATSQSIPKEHKFSVSNIAMQTLGVISQTPGNPEAVPPTVDKISVEGKVVQRAECRPIQSKNYMDIKKEAISKAGEPMRRVVRLDKHVTTSFRPITNHLNNIQYDKQKKVEGKKMRDDKEKVQEILFALFEKHQYYNIKDLVTETRQPAAYLKEILKEVCDYNVRQPHRNMWELKKEYRHYKPEEEKKEKKEDDSSDDE